MRPPASTNSVPSHNEGSRFFIARSAIRPDWRSTTRIPHHDEGISPALRRSLECTIHIGVGPPTSSD